KGTKAAALYAADIAPAKSWTICARLMDQTPPHNPADAGQFFGTSFDKVFVQRVKEADEFYSQRAHVGMGDDARLVQRQAFAGLLWGKQSYHYDVRRWLQGDPTQPTPP